MISDNKRELASAHTFDEVFQLVKRATERSLRIHRAGLTLVLGDIPNNVGAFHQLGGNAIVMNRNLLRIVERTSRSKVRKNSYIFMILLHEYLHSLGYVDDRQVRLLSKKITNEFFGGRHIAAEMAVKPLDQFFPELPKFASFRDRGHFETVNRFDSSSTSYIA